MPRYDDGWRPYVSMAQRRRRAAQTIASLERAGRVIRPVDIEGRTIARTFWGQSWCRNLEAYSDFANRLPRGRTYVRNGSVIDLKIEAGRVHALVNGTSVYNVKITIKQLTRRKWAAIRSQCAGQLDSIVELLQGSISDNVMAVVTRPGEGLFPGPRDISLRCSCPDWATMCKHVAAVLYGVGARLDHEPEMLFTLRGVAPAELIEAAVTDVPTRRKTGGRKRLKSADISSVFGIGLDIGAAQPKAVGTPKRSASRPKAKRTATKRTKNTKQPENVPAKSACKKKLVTKKPGPKTAKTATQSRARPRTMAKKSAKLAMSERMKALRKKKIERLNKTDT